MTAVVAATQFDRTTALTPLGDQRWAAHLDASWASLRGIHGGYVAAILVGAFERSHPERPVRTVHVSFLRGAATGPAEVDTSVVRHGRSLTVGRVRLRQAGRLVAEATITGGTPRAAHAWASPPLEPPAERSACVPLAPPPGIGHFDQADAVIDPADVPFTSGPRARIAGHVRPIEPRPIDARWLTMLGDWFPPAAFPRFAAPIGGVSVDYLVHVHGLPDLAPGAALDEDAAWLTAAFEVRDATDGLALEEGWIADASGRVLARTFHTRLL